MSNNSKNQIIRRTIKNEILQLEILSEMLDELEGLFPLDLKARFTIHLIMEELVSNVINHGYEDTDLHEIELSFFLDDSVLTMEIIDDGVAFDPLAYQEPDIDVPIEDRQPGRLGVRLVRARSDHIEYKRNENKNILTVIKKLA